jgi:diacylglycerol kinase (ATP)
VIAVPGIAVLFNPNTRRNRKTPGLARQMQRMLGSDGVLLITKTVDHLPEAAARCLADGVEVVGLSGGDGTLHAVTTELARVYAKAGKDVPPIALLRGGTMNTIAKGMKTLRGTPLSILDHLIERYRRQERFRIVPRSALDLDGGREFGFLFGLGMPVSFLRAYYKGSGRGAAKGAEVLGRLVLSTVMRSPYARAIFSPVPACVSVDGGERRSRRYTAIMAATVTEVGLGFAPFRRAPETPDRFQILAAAEPPLRIAAQIRRLYTGARLRGDVLDELAKETMIETERDVDYMFDGEIRRGGTRFHLRTGPQISFIQG